MSAIILQGLKSPLSITQGFGFAVQPSGGFSGDIPSGGAYVLGRFESCDWQNIHRIVRASASGSFNIDLVSSPDDSLEGVVKQVSSGAVNVDGGTTGYLNAAEMDCRLPFKGRVEITNTAGASISFYADVRTFYSSR